MLSELLYSLSQVVNFLILLFGDKSVYGLQVSTITDGSHHIKS